MARKIVILGSGGRLGAALLRAWRLRGEDVVGFPRAELDVADAPSLQERLAPLPFDVLVNCAAQTNVDHCERAPEEAWRVNAAAPGALARLCTAKAARCVHLSTDYVFDGNKQTPYDESDEPHPLSHYGRSKLAGEHEVLAASARHLVVRVSWVFGPDRASFLDHILERAQQQEQVAAIADKVSSPTYTLDAAALLGAVLERPQICGTLHLCNGGECSWQEYGQHALDCAADLGWPLRTRKVEPLRLAEMTAFVARRPVYTPLATARLTAALGVAPRGWREAVHEYVRTRAETRRC